jgi:hypothetical protein
MPKDGKERPVEDDEALADMHAKFQAERGYVEHRALRPAVEIVEGVRPLSPVERERLAREINGALWDYAMTKTAPTLHTTARPLSILIEEFDRGPNTLAILAMLGAPIPFLLTGQDQESVDRQTAQLHEAMARYANLMRELETVAKKVPKPPAKQNVGKKANVRLYQLVDRLVDCWEEFTGETFKQDWHRENGEWRPATADVYFVHTVVGVIDPAQVRRLKTVVENTVTKRNKSASRKRRR